ncbi:hypothetical protein BpHYR1_018729 [Brachionus plicatilis]|uniref:Uncharacterized protein n=1 Tax=Brachionus plicatilis TaxID=10195 RepID=A0A3M7S4E0_BRAPC|nr:hypothetical protein BpHYR1_018729 [Brachionus plicatilis]
MVLAADFSLFPVVMIGPSLSFTNVVLFYEELYKRFILVIILRKPSHSILYECFINELSMNIDEPSSDLMKNQ